jgi:hypothetical protein
MKPKGNSMSNKRNQERAIKLIQIAEKDIGTYLKDPKGYLPEYFESVQMALAEALTIMEEGLLDINEDVPSNFFGESPANHRSIRK